MSPTFSSIPLSLLFHTYLPKVPICSAMSQRLLCFIHQLPLVFCLFWLVHNASRTGQGCFTHEIFVDLSGSLATFGYGPHYKGLTTTTICKSILIVNILGKKITTQFHIKSLIRGGVAQWVARLTRDRWIPISREFESHQRPPLFPWARNFTLIA